MDDYIRKIYVPMSETAFYILFCLQTPQHGYGISQEVKKMTAGEVTIAPGTMYGTLSKMEKNGLICFVEERETRKIYQLTNLGKEVLNVELKRIYRLYQNSIGGEYHG